MTVIALEVASRLVAQALAHGRKSNLKPLTVAVLDPGGHLVAFAREDNSSNLRPQIAAGKANAALAMGVRSRQVAEMAAERPSFVAAAGALASGGFVPAAGGLLIRDSRGDILGAIGVSGDTSDNDELCAIHAVESAGLIAD